MDSEEKVVVPVVDSLTEEHSLYIIFDDIFGAPIDQYNNYSPRIKGTNYSGLIYSMSMTMFSQLWKFEKPYFWVKFFRNYKDPIPSDAEVPEDSVTPLPLLKHLASINVADAARTKEENVAQQEDHQFTLAMSTTSNVAAKPLSTTTLSTRLAPETPPPTSSSVAPQVTRQEFMR